VLRMAPPVRRTARTIVDATALKAQLAKVREQGWCIVDQELEEGLVSLSAPIRDRSGRAIAAMNISGQVNRTSPAYMVEHFLPKLRAAAADISRMLQHKA
jgi:IclR family transcriptional regulator, pca regulon regulatory protein